MARPIEPTPALMGRDAERFLKKQERIENLELRSRDRGRKAFFRECEANYARVLSRVWSRAFIPAAA
ncbi:MAG: hypothetical protein JW724_05155 [Candidatus Altiarchaeota archaeon]|nr:hypothetical protein [Candidatus Altiarchaeota archaeon]